MFPFFGQIIYFLSPSLTNSDHSSLSSSDILLYLFVSPFRFHHSPSFLCFRMILHHSFPFILLLFSKYHLSPSCLLLLLPTLYFYKWSIDTPQAYNYIKHNYLMMLSIHRYYVYLRMSF